MEDTIYNDGIEVQIANASHEKYVDEILETISAAAKVRGTVLPNVHTSMLRRR